MQNIWSVAEADIRSQDLADDPISQLEFCTAFLSEDHDFCTLNWAST